MNLIQELEREEVQRLCAEREGSREIPDFGSGDTLRVNVKIKEGARERIQAFEGVCIAKSGGGLNESFTVRKISFGVGVERLFPVYSPVVDSIIVTRRGVVRRAKLYYLRDRRGRSARIAERRTKGQETEEFSLNEEGASVVQGSRAQSVRLDGEFGADRDSGEANLYGEPRSALSPMVAVLKQLQNLKGAAEGPKVLAAIQRASELLPEPPLANGRRSDLHELSLTIGEHLCPLMFSHDKAVAKASREALTQLGSILRNREGRDANDLRAMLSALQVAVVVHLSITQHARAMGVRLEAQDVMFAALRETAFHGRAQVRIQLLLEDMGEDIVESLGEASLGGAASGVVEGRIQGDANALAAKLLTIVADGQEIYRSKVTRTSERVFVI